MAGMGAVVGRKLLHLTAEAASLAAAGTSLGAPACECVCAGSSSLLAAGGGGPLLVAHGAAEEEGLTPQQRLLFIGVSIFLTIMAGLMSGLTLGKGGALVCSTCRRWRAAGEMQNASAS